MDTYVVAQHFRKTRRWFMSQTKLFQILFGILSLAFFALLITITLAILDRASLARSFGPSSQYVWMGGLTANSIQFKLRPDRKSLSSALPIQFLLQIYADQSLKSVVSQQTIESNKNVVPFYVNNLNPNSNYYYQFSINGIPANDLKGSFRTAPSKDNLNFSFALASCAETGSDHSVFTKIKEKSPLFFLHMGDFGYANVIEDNDVPFRHMYDIVFGSRRQSSLWKNVPIAYMWDDHDFGPNNAWKGSPSRPAARRMYEEYVPHYPLVAQEALRNRTNNNDSSVNFQETPIYQAFTIGRARFILLDLRYYKDDASLPDNENKTMIGSEQKEWLKRELLSTTDPNNNISIVFLMSSIPWIFKPKQTSEKWAGFSTEREEISKFIFENNISHVTVGNQRRSRLFMLSGDTHMVAFDDGTHNVYHGNDQYKGFPVFQAAPLDKTVSAKGGPFTHGCSPHNGQFGTIKVIDDGSSVPCVELAAHRVSDGDSDHSHVDQIFLWNSCEPTPGTGQIGKCVIELREICKWCFENYTYWILLMLMSLIVMLILVLTVVLYRLAVALVPTPGTQVEMEPLTLQDE